MRISSPAEVAIPILASTACNAAFRASVHGPDGTAAIAALMSAILARVRWYLQLVRRSLQFCALRAVRAAVTAAALDAFVAAAASRAAFKGATVVS